MIYDRRYKQPLVLLSELEKTAYTIWRLYRDLRPIEQVPLSAKHMLRAERAFVFSRDALFRLLELALLAGNMLSWD